MFSLVVGGHNPSGETRKVGDDGSDAETCPFSYGDGRRANEINGLRVEKVRRQTHPLRQFLLRQRSLRPIETSEIPRKRGLFGTKLLTSRDRRKAVFVSLRPFVSKAPDFGKTVRIFKSLITCGYLAR